MSIAARYAAMTDDARTAFLRSLPPEKVNDWAALVRRGRAELSRAAAPRMVTPTHAPARARSKAAPLDDALEALMKLAEGDGPDAERAKRLLAVHFGADEDDTDPNPAPPPATRRAQFLETPMNRNEIIARAEQIARDPSASAAVRREAASLLAEARAVAPHASTPTRPYHEQALLDRMDRNQPQSATVRHEGASMSLLYVAPSVAAARVREMRAEGGDSHPFEPSLAVLDARIARGAGR
jgi:hypothetical protein